MKQGKLNQRWRPYYQIVEQTGPVTFKVLDQFGNEVKSNLKRAKIEDYDIPEVTEKGKSV